MEHTAQSHPPEAPPLLPDTVFAFHPVPMATQRRDGWTPSQQSRFIESLAAMGSVGAALRAVGMARASAYRLRERAGAESFAAAWDKAIELGRTWQFTVALERAMDGVTTVRVLRGGAIDVTQGPDMRMATQAMREDRPPRPGKETKETI